MGLLLAIVTFLAPEYWIELLGADSIEMREEAMRRLKRFGWSAMPALMAAERHPDPEIAERVQTLLGSISLGDRLSPEFRAAMPGVEERLSAGNDEEWLRVFLEASRLPRATTKDLECLVEPASRGARTREDRIEILRFLLKARILWTMRILGEYMADSDAADVAWEGLNTLRPKFRVEALTWYLERREGELRRDFVYAVRDLDAEDAVRSLDLDHPRPGVGMLAAVLREQSWMPLASGADDLRVRVIRMLELVPDETSLLLLTRLVHDSSVAVRIAALAAITRIVNREN